MSNIQVKYERYNLPSDFPIVNSVIIAICVAIYVIPAIISDKLLFLRAIWDGSSALYMQIENKLCLVPILLLHEPYRIVTATFLHANGIHILFNMYALAVLGIPLERIFGRARFLAIYITSMLGGGFTIIACSIFFDKSDVQYITPTVGASGAIFGLLACTFWVVKKLNAPTTNIIATIVLNAFISFTVPNISWQGHIGGFLSGLLIGWIFLNLPFKRQKFYSILYGVGINVLFVVLSFVLLTTSGLPNY
jgi:membrane associated rhomboid family serine protease